MALLVYVDNIIITGAYSTFIDQLKQHLFAQYHMKDLGSPTYFLGLEVFSGPSGISLNENKYACDLVATAGLQDSPPVDTHIELNLKLRKES